MMVSRKNWEIYREAIGKSNSSLFLIMASRQFVHAPKEITHTEYVGFTDKRLNKFKDSRIKVAKVLAAQKEKNKKTSYINFDKSILRIPIKNTFEIKVHHYAETKKHDAKPRSPTYDFQEFCKKYKITQNRKNKHKFNKIIQSL